MRQDESGMIVVEFIGSFMMFIFIIISILSLVNIYTLQARVHFAATQAAETVSMYSYVLQVTGAADKMRNLEKNAKAVETEANAFKKDVNDMIDGFTEININKTLTHAGAAYERVGHWITDTAGNPKNALSKMVNYGIGEASHLGFGEIMRLLMGRYLSNGTMNGDEYLKSVMVTDGLSGLKFYDFSLFDFEDLSENDSVLLTEDGDVVIIVRYTVDYTFGSLPLPFTELEISHVIKTKAWLDGNGKGYWK